MKQYSPVQATAATMALIALGASLLLGLSPASAMKPASGSNCSGNWVNNEAAMACFTQGEDEANSGAAHPHYVACTSDDVMCCVDDSKGNQTCSSVGPAKAATRAQWAKAILSAHRTMLMSIGRYSGKGVPLQSEIPRSTVKAAP